MQKIVSARKLNRADFVDLEPHTIVVWSTPLSKGLTLGGYFLGDRLFNGRRVHDCQLPKFAFRLESGVAVPTVTKKLGGRYH